MKFTILPCLVKLPGSLMCLSFAFVYMDFKAVGFLHIYARK